MSVLQFPTFAEDDLVLYSFAPRAESPDDMMITRYDEEWHEELTSRRNYNGCRLVMRAAELRAVHEEILREARK